MVASEPIATHKRFPAVLLLRNFTDGLVPPVAKPLLLCTTAGGPGGIENLMPLLVVPATVTTTLPLVAPLGAGTRILPALQLAGVATVPLKVIVLLFCELPKLLP